MHSSKRGKVDIRVVGHNQFYKKLLLSNLKTKTQKATKIIFENRWLRIVIAQREREREKIGIELVAYH